MNDPWKFVGNCRNGWKLFIWARNQTRFCMHTTNSPCTYCIPRKAENECLNILLGRTSTFKRIRIHPSPSNFCGHGENQRVATIQIILKGSSPPLSPPSVHAHWAGSGPQPCWKTEPGKTARREFTALRSLQATLAKLRDVAPKKPGTCATFEVHYEATGRCIAKSSSKTSHGFCTLGSTCYIGGWWLIKTSNWLLQPGGFLSNSPNSRRVLKEVVPKPGLLTGSKTWRFPSMVHSGRGVSCKPSWSNFQNFMIKTSSAKHLWEGFINPKRRSILRGDFGVAHLMEPSRAILGSKDDGKSGWPGGSMRQIHCPKWHFADVFW